jgi:uncharacterized protein
LDAIGAFGVLRCAAFSGAKNRPLFVPEHKAIENISQEQYLQESTNNNSAITHFHGNFFFCFMRRLEQTFYSYYYFYYYAEKLFRLKTMMRTSKGKALALERDRFMEDFVDQIHREFNI